MAGSSRRAHHHGEYRPLDGDVGQLHPPWPSAATGAGASAGLAPLAGAASLAATFRPGRSLPVPSTTMRCPASRPCLISTTPARRAPVTTSTRSTLSSAVLR
ncbi:hypothetical protein G6F22_021907 [Rhizopus arrhizus]|nr:hypothetical protein G6F22_021907 [Rhizopus arrhizus]